VCPTVSAARAEISCGVFFCWSGESFGSANLKAECWACYFAEANYLEVVYLRSLICESADFYLGVRIRDVIWEKRVREVFGSAIFV